MGVSTDLILSRMIRGMRWRFLGLGLGLVSFHGFTMGFGDRCCND